MQILATGLTLSARGAGKLDHHHGHMIGQGQSRPFNQMAQRSLGVLLAV